ncbi:hypothetical protein EDC44_105102 [Cricetibacter osteomyelitidis]|uniref:Uncharacterized protein n=1 Tax=Cricetibacter osteomyelitidis TaxID=1521931 RepID=A0A4R2T451_9PAST|nr:hypothetical protein EDC44_105102 [Cricetibacter osteomyelitidis]
MSDINISLAIFAALMAALAYLAYWFWERPKHKK